LDEEKTFKIAALFLIAAILLSIGLIINGVLKTCDENYNPLAVVTRAGYICTWPYYNMQPYSVNFSNLSDTTLKAIETKIKERPTSIN